MSEFAPNIRIDSRNQQNQEIPDGRIDKNDVEALHSRLKDIESSMLRMISQNPQDEDLQLQLIFFQQKIGFVETARTLSDSRKSALLSPLVEFEINTHIAFFLARDYYRQAKEFSYDIGSYYRNVPRLNDFYYQANAKENGVYILSDAQVDEAKKTFGAMLGLNPDGISIVDPSQIAEIAEQDNSIDPNKITIKYTARGEKKGRFIQIPKPEQLPPELRVSVNEDAKSLMQEFQIMLGGNDNFLYLDLENRSEKGQAVRITLNEDGETISAHISRVDSKTLKVIVDNTNGTRDVAYIEEGFYIQNPVKILQRVLGQYNRYKITTRDGGAIRIEDKHSERLRTGTRSLDWKKVTIGENFVEIPLANGATFTSFEWEGDQLRWMDTNSETGTFEFLSNNQVRIICHSSGKSATLPLGQNFKVALQTHFHYGVRKPVIYLYPEKDENVRLSVSLKEGEITTEYPKTIDGVWDVIASPNGEIQDKKTGKKYSYLFWEAKKPSGFNIDLKKAFCISSGEAESFLEKSLEELGLNEKERNDFIVYWLPKLEQNPFNVIQFLEQDYTDYASLNVNPKPKNIIRVFMIFRAAKERIDVGTPSLKKNSRSGFTLVEWGGTDLNESPFEIM